MWGPICLEPYLMMIFAGKKDPKLFVWIVKTFDFVQVKKLEAQGVPSKHAEAITAAITEVLNDSLVNVAHSFVSKAETQKVGFFFFSVSLCIIAYCVIVSL